LLRTHLTSTRKSFFTIFSPRSEWVELSHQVRVKTDALVTILRGKRARSRDLDFESWSPPKISKRDRDLWSELDDVDHRLAEVASHGEAERKAAKRLDVDPLEVARAAHALWNVGLTGERNERLKEQAPKDADERTLAALRGHLTRDLTEEVRQLLARKRRGRKGSR
jgi:hypothetical protein